MTAVFCVNTADRTAETWGKKLARFERLEFAVSDGTKGGSNSKRPFGWGSWWTILVGTCAIVDVTS